MRLCVRLLWQLVAQLIHTCIISWAHTSLPLPSPSCISIGSAVFAGLIDVPQKHKYTHRPRNVRHASQYAASVWCLQVAARPKIIEIGWRMSKYFWKNFNGNRQSRWKKWRYFGNCARKMLLLPTIDRTNRKCFVTYKATPFPFWVTSRSFS